MTSREFIARQFGNADGKSKSLSSIYKDSQGQIYSYGHHYPLLFKVGRLVFVNTAGYSNTTGKHIGWAWSAADYNAIGVKVRGSNQYSWSNSENQKAVPYLLNNARYDGDLTKPLLEAVINDLVAERDEIRETMATKKRQNTAIYASLQSSLDRVEQSLAAVRAELATV